ncbi:MAG: class I SAM-dependent methyltransferase [Chloroflexi bacterium]|nr:class I SAM-dependent methyltransferase [Chloroflexota bacterium]
MGYLRHKYVKAYYLAEDTCGNRTPYGVAGIDDFRKGDIRKIDKDILRRVNFEGKTVLDLGCGRGEAIKFAIQKGAKKVVGVDFSEDANLIARDFLEKHGVRADLHCQDALSFLQSYAEHSNSQVFDIVLMLDFIEHVPRAELTRTLMCLHRVIHRHGIVAVNTPVYPVDNDVITNGIDPRADDFGDTFEETFGMHCNRYSAESLQSYMADCGFTAISGHFFVPVPFASPKKVGHRISWCLASVQGFPIHLAAITRCELFAYADPVQASAHQRLYDGYLPRRIMRFAMRMAGRLARLVGYSSRN